MNKAKAGWHSFINNPWLAGINRVCCPLGPSLRSQNKWAAFLKHLACLGRASWFGTSLRAPLPKPSAARRKCAAGKPKPCVRRELSFWGSAARLPVVNPSLLLTALETWAFYSTLLCLSFFSCRMRSLKRVAGYKNWSTYIILFWMGLLIGWYVLRYLRKDISIATFLGRGNSALHVLRREGLSRKPSCLSSLCF